MCEARPRPHSVARRGVTPPPLLASTAPNPRASRSRLTSVVFRQDLGRQRGFLPHEAGGSWECGESEAGGVVGFAAAALMGGGGGLVAAVVVVELSGESMEAAVDVGARLVRVKLGFDHAANLAAAPPLVRIFPPVNAGFAARGTTGLPC